MLALNSSIGLTQQLQNYSFDNSLYSKNELPSKNVNIFEKNKDVDISSQQAGRYNHEDAYSIEENINIPQIGNISIYGIYDGHKGDSAAKFLASEFGLSAILISKLSHTAYPLNTDNIIQIFRESIIKLQERIPKYSGSTVVLVLIIKETGLTFNYTSGDCRWIYSNLDGDILINSVREIDFALETDTQRTGYLFNSVHQINGDIISKTDSVSKDKPLKVSEDNLNQFYCEGDDNNKTSFKEWCAWNKSLNSNPSQIIKFPKKDSRCWRMPSGIHPTRSHGDGGLVCNFGVLSITQLKDPQNTILLMNCDGSEDNNSTNPYTLAKYSQNFKFAEDNFLKDHFCFKWSGVSDYDIPSNLDFLSQIKWIKSLFMGPLCKFDKDFQRSVDEAIEYFETHDVEHHNPSCEALVRYCQARLSGDNITILKKHLV